MLALQELFERIAETEGAEYVLFVLTPIGLTVAALVFWIGRVIGERSAKERMRQKRIRDLDRLKQLGA